LQKDEDQVHRKIKLRVDDVVGNKCLTNFHGMDLTSDRLRSLIRKWQTLIEARVEVKTTDGYLLRLFAVGFTQRRRNQKKKFAYAKESHCRRIRKKMMSIMTQEVSSVELRDLVDKFIPEGIGKRIEDECQGIYPLQNVFIRKVKVLKLPKFDPTKLLELHEDKVVPEDTGKKVV